MPCIIGTKSGHAYVTGYETRIFSRAGFGDVLAGKVGAYWLRYSSTELACLHGLLDGFEKSQQYLAEKSGSLAPFDLI
jgi:NAD(P)H-hydrate epimerase